MAVSLLGFYTVIGNGNARAGISKDSDQHRAVEKKSSGCLFTAMDLTASGGIKRRNGLAACPSDKQALLRGE